MNSFKDVISNVEKVVGLDHQVRLKLREWTGVGDFIVVPLDDFNVVLGQEFMKKEKETLMPHLDCLVFLAQKDPRGVHLVKLCHSTFINGILKNTPNFTIF